MINKLFICGSHDTYPYKNIATEEYLTKTADPGSVILFLWQNRRTVVIGRNQNCFAECDIQALEGDGGFLARRLSGGGAVFHDTKNLNFSFCVRRPDYDISRQTEVILRAVKLLGIDARLTGRNDITADGRKFSGHAYFKTGECCCHHGTILIDTDGSLMTRYLRPDTEKLKSKGVASVRSRVCNLKEFQPDITVSEVKEVLIQAFAEVYDADKKEVLQINTEDLPTDILEEGTQRYSSHEWLYGKNLTFDHSFGKRFPWGNVTFELKVKGNRIETARIWSDAMEPELIQMISESLRDCIYSPYILSDRIASVTFEDSIAGADISRMKADINRLITESL